MRTVKNQIVRCAPSSAVNYRGACRAKSTKNYISKMETVEGELNERMFWLDFTVGLSESYLSQIKPLLKEGDEPFAIIVSSIITTKENNNKKSLYNWSDSEIKY